jgi:hypothetical protein
MWYKAPLKQKGIFYSIAINLQITMLYGTQYWVVKSQKEGRLGVTVIRMLEWMSGLHKMR